MTRKIPEELKTNLASGSIDRRQFMRGAVSAGVALSTATVFADKVAASTPKRGGRLKAALAHGATSDTLDPGLYENNFTTSATHGFNGYLTEVAADGTLVPSVAESWEASADAATWTFRIRNGVEFHDGRALTAKDVIASLNHHRGEASTSAAKPLLASVTDIKADDKHTVVVSLDRGNADFPFILTDYHVVIQPEKDGKMDWKAGIGCGPYRLDTWQPGVSATFSKYESHWNPEVGHFDEIEMLSVIDTNARTTALVSGDVDVIDRVDLKTAAMLGRNAGISVHSIPGGSNSPSRCAATRRHSMTLMYGARSSMQSTAKNWWTKFFLATERLATTTRFLRGCDTITTTCRRPPMIRTRRSSISNKPDFRT